MLQSSEIHTPTSGRSPLNDLGKTIVDLGTAGAGADSRRYTDVLNACKTLDNFLRAVLFKEGYVSSPTALHIRLIPRRSDTGEGKRHELTVAVKIRKAKNNLRNKHQGQNSTFVTKQCMKDIAFYLTQEMFVLFVDDKAQVPIDVTAATKQSSLLMHVTYEIRLPDHHFVKAKLKLTPSVYAACVFRTTSSKAVPEIF